MENKYVLQLKKVILEVFKNDNVRIVCFGSRARRDSSMFSDVDIGVIPREKIKEKKFTLAREKIESLNIPYKVELVNFSEVSPDFKKEALKEVIVWKD